jgi:predicted ester cyclase
VSEANVEVMRRQIANLVAGDVDAVLADMAAPYEVKILGVSDEPVAGAAAVRELASTLFSAFSPLTIEIQSIDADDEAGFAELAVGGVQAGEFDGIPPSGDEVVQSVCVVATFRDGKVVGGTVYADRREVLRQIGYTAEISAAVS